MAERLGEALLDLDTNDKAFRKGIDRAERDATGLGRTLDGVSRKAIAMGKGLAVGAGVGIAAMGVLVKRSIDLADEMSKSALRAGVTTEELSRLAWAGELSDVSLGALTTSMARLSNVMADVARGGAKDTKAVFDAIGVSVTDAEGELRSTAEVMPELADVFAGMSNDAERSALAIKIFGRSGADLIPLLINGSAGLRDMANEADHLGKTISTQTGRDAEKFNDTLTRIGAVVDGVGLKMATGLLPQLQDLADRLADPDFATAAQGMATAVITAIDGIVQIVVGASKALQDFLNLLNTAANRGPLSQQAALLDDNELAREIADAQKIMASPTSNSVARERSGPWLKELLAQRDLRTSADPVGGGSSWSEMQSMFGTAPGAGTGGTSDWSGLFSDIGSSAAAAEDKVAALLASLRAERDVMRETDPVQQRLISMRADLATATVAQRDEVEGLVRTIHEETRAMETATAMGQLFGDTLIDSIDGLLDGSKSLVDVLGDVGKMLQRAVLQGALLGQGPLGGLFGGTGANGLGGMVGSLFSGFFAKGGLIPNGSFGIVGEAGPEPVIGTSRGARVLPNSALAGFGGGSVEVNINNYAGVQVTATESSNGRGGKRIDVTINEAVANALATPRSPAQKAMAGAGALVSR